MRRRVVLGLLLGVALSGARASAHPLAPALLELRETGNGRVAVTWKTSALAIPGTQLAPVLPSACRPLGSPDARRAGGGVIERWEMDCGAAGLAGLRLAVRGLDAAGVEALVRVQRADGRRVQHVLRAREPAWTVPARPQRLGVARGYLALGVEHIATGLDHLLFVFGLLLLVRGGRALLATLTAFTLGHSVTLSLAVLGLARVPPGPVELAIAGSVFALAVEISRRAAATRAPRFPWVLAGVFGLLHGLGFAGALREAGLPEAELPTALLAFNVGIELGQLAFVAGVLGARALLAPQLGRLPAWCLRAPEYALGALAASWCIERGAALLA